MKSTFCNSLRRLGARWSFLLSATGLLCSVSVTEATQLLWKNNGTITAATNIDAVNFNNSGTWNILVSPYPFMTANTLTYSNTGTMDSSIGWEFDYGPSQSGSSSSRDWSSIFFNDNNGTISAASSIGKQTQTVPVGYLLVSATNIVNKGILSADAYSEILLTGSNVDVSRSTVEIVPIAGSEASANTSSAFTGAAGVFDQYWGQTTLNSMNSSAIWNGSTVASPTFNATEICATTLQTQIGFMPAVSDSTNFVTPGAFILLSVTNVFATTNVFQPDKLYATNFFGTNIVLGATNFFGTNTLFGTTNFFGTNVVFGATNVLGTNILFETTNFFGTNIYITSVSFATNVIRQAVFINILDTNAITGQVRFSPSSNPTNFFQTVAVQLSSPSTNVLTFAAQTNSLYLVDTLASATNSGVLPNTLVSPYAECSGATFRPANYVLSRTDAGAFAIGVPGAGEPANNFLYQADFTNQYVNSTYADYSALVGNQLLQLSPTSSITNLPGRIRITADNLNLGQTGISANGQIVIQASNLITSVGAVVNCENLSFNLGSSTGNLNVTNLAMNSVNGFNGTVSCWSAVWTNIETVVITNNYSISNVVLTVSNVVSTNVIPVLSPLTNSVSVGLYALLVDAGELAPKTPVVVQDLVLHSTNMVVSDPMNVANTLLFDGQSLTLNTNLSLSLSILNWTYALAPTLRYFTNNGVLDIPNDAHFGDDGPTNYLVFVNNGIISSDDQTINADKLQINNGTNETLAGDFYGITQTGQLSGASIFSDGAIQFTAGSLQINQTVLQASNTLYFNVTGSLFDGGFGSGNFFQCQNGFNLLTKPATGDLLGTTITSIALGKDEVLHTWAALDDGTNYAGFTNNAAVGDLALVAQNPSTGNPLFVFSGTGSSNAMYVGYLDFSKLSTNNFADLETELQIDPNLVIYYANAKLGFTPPSGTAAQYLNGQFGGHLKWIQGYTSQVTKLSASDVNGGGSFQLTLSGIPGQSYIIQASTNLVNWVNILTNTPPLTFMDLQATNYNNRFYRALIEP
jgi:hypothetical protein